MLLDTSSTWAAVPVRMPSGDDPTHYTSSLSPLDPTYETLGAFISGPRFITCLLTNQLHLARPHIAAHDVRRWETHACDARAVRSALPREVQVTVLCTE